MSPSLRFALRATLSAFLLIVCILPTTLFAEEFLTERKLPEDGYIFKHSTQCPISRAAAEEVRSATFPLPLYWIDVLEQRDLSQWVARELDVKHESPQLLRIKDGKALQVWNHREVRRENFLPSEDE